MVNIIQLVTLSFVVAFITYLLHILTYWKTKKVPHKFISKFKISIEIFREPYDYFKSKGEKYFGLNLSVIPVFVPIDLDLIRNILSKDFQYFHDHGTYYNEKDDPLSAHLFSLSGPKWRKLRTKLTPTFSSGKIKVMFQTLLDCSKPLLERVEVDARKCVDVKEIFSCYTTDVIGSCAFGLDCNTFVDGSLGKRWRDIFKPRASSALRRNFVNFFPKFSRFLRLRAFRKEISDFFMGIVRETVDYRERFNYVRKDFMQLLMEMKKKEFDGRDVEVGGLTFEEIAAQAFVFFLAGFETSASTMTFCLYELALNQNIQDKLRNEIISVLERFNGDITYEAVMEMKYLGQVIEGKAFTFVTYFYPFMTLLHTFLPPYINF